MKEQVYCDCDALPANSLMILHESKNAPEINALGATFHVPEFWEG